MIEILKICVHKKIIIFENKKSHCELIKLNKNVVIVCIYLNLFPKFYFICYSLHNFTCDQNGRSTRKNQIFDFLSVRKRSSISFPTTINNIVKTISQIRSIPLRCKFVRIHSTAHSDGNLIIHQNAYFAHGWRSHILLASASFSFYIYLFSTTLFREALKKFALYFSNLTYLDYNDWFFYLVFFPICDLIGCG